MSVINEDGRIKYYEYSSETAEKYKVINWFVLSMGLMIFSGALYLEVIITDFLLTFYNCPDDVRIKVTCGNIYVITSIFLFTCAIVLVKGKKSLMEHNIIYAIDKTNTLYQYNFGKRNSTPVIPSQLDNPVYAIFLTYVKMKEATKKVDRLNDSIKSAIKFNDITSFIVKDKYFIIEANVSKTNRKGRVKNYKCRKKIYKQYEGIEELIESISQGVTKGGCLECVR